MKVLKCEKCDRIQKQGKFCLDCGNKIKEIITNDIKFKPIDTMRTSDHLKRDVRNWLSRIGVQQPDIKISTSGDVTTIEYMLDNTLYSFSSYLQKSITNNIAAIEQFLHHRVLGIERGIETVEQAFAGYEALPDYTEKADFDPYLALGFKQRVSLEEARKKFKRLVKKYHPDLNPNKDTQKEFMRLTKAMDLIEELEP